MSLIQDCLNKIKTAVFGEEVRQSFIDAIKQCYKDATGHPESVSAVVNEIDEVKENIKEVSSQIDEKANQSDLKLLKNVTLLGAKESNLDNSQYFKSEDYLVVNDGKYALDKDTILDCVNSKTLVGNGSIYWKDWGTPSSNLLSSELKVSYINDKVYTSMKLPSEAITYMTSRVNGQILNYQKEGCITANPIGAIYQAKDTTLPDEFDICIGKIAMYSLMNTEDAEWKQEGCYLLNGNDTFAFYKLPWTSHIVTNVDSSKVTYYNDYVKFHLKKDDIIYDGQVLHFYPFSRNIDIPNTLGLISMYEVWTETPEAVGCLVAAIGVDQKDADNKNACQAFSGRNFLITKNKRIVIGHNMSDEIYENCINNNKEPNKCLDIFKQSSVSTYTSIPRLDLLDKLFYFKYDPENCNKFIQIAEYTPVVRNDHTSQGAITFEISSINGNSCITNRVKCIIYASYSETSNNNTYRLKINSSDKKLISEQKIIGNIVNGVYNIYMKIPELYTWDTFRIRDIAISHPENLIFTDQFLNHAKVSTLNGSDTYTDTIESIDDEIDISLTVASLGAGYKYVDDVDYNNDSYIINGYDSSISCTKPSTTQAIWLVENKYVSDNPVSMIQTWTSLSLSTIEKYERVLYKGKWSNFINLIQMNN